MSTSESYSIGLADLAGRLGSLTRFTSAVSLLGYILRSATDYFSSPTYRPLSDKYYPIHIPVAAVTA